MCTWRSLLHVYFTYTDLCDTLTATHDLHDALRWSQDVLIQYTVLNVMFQLKSSTALFYFMSTVFYLFYFYSSIGLLSSWL